MYHEHAAGRINATPALIERSVRRVVAKIRMKLPRTLLRIYGYGCFVGSKAFSHSRIHAYADTDLRRRRREVGVEFFASKNFPRDKPRTRSPFAVFAEWRGIALVSLQRIVLWRNCFAAVLRSRVRGNGGNYSTRAPRRAARRICAFAATLALFANEFHFF